MAALDFPASPTNGQYFAAPNGVTYQYDSTKGLWLAAGTPASVAGGDFYARHNGAIAVGASGVTIGFDTVVTGNSGGWFTPANGRYTPPAGRYVIYSGLTLLGSTNAIFGMSLRKNGATIASSANSNAPSAGSYYTPMFVEATVDANGSDWFDVQASASAGTGSSGGGTANFFGAHPVGALIPIPTLPAGVLGDFCAFQTSGFPSTTAAYVTVTPPTIFSGNSGNWYNPATGIFTPPAGRYHVSGFISLSNTASSQIRLRKNSVSLGSGVDIPASANGGGWIKPAIEVNVDANGTDQFDLQAYVGAGTITWQSIGFMAFPIGALVALPQVPGSLILYSEQVLTSGATQMDVTVPVNAKRIDLEYSWFQNTDDSLGLRVLESGVPITANSYSYQITASGGGGVSSGSATSTSWNMSGARSSAGQIKMYPNPRSPGWMGTNFQNLITATTRYMHDWSYDLPCTTSLTTGFRLFTAGTFNAGSFLRAYVVT